MRETIQKLRETVALLREQSCAIRDDKGSNFTEEELCELDELALAVKHSSQRVASAVEMNQWRCA